MHADLDFPVAAKYIKKYRQGFSPFIVKKRKPQDDMKVQFKLDYSDICHIYEMSLVPGAGAG